MVLRLLSWHIYVTDQWLGGVGGWVGSVSSGLLLRQVNYQNLPLEHLEAVGMVGTGTVYAFSRLNTVNPSHCLSGHSYLPPFEQTWGQGSCASHPIGSVTSGCLLPTPPPGAPPPCPQHTHILCLSQAAG